MWLVFSLVAWNYTMNKNKMQQKQIRMLFFVIYSIWYGFEAECKSQLTKNENILITRPLNYWKLYSYSLMNENKGIKANL